MVRSTHFVYAWRLKMAWDVKNWDWESTKTSRIEKLTVVLDFHDSWKVRNNNNQCLFYFYNFVSSKVC